MVDIKAKLSFYSTTKHVRKITHYPKVEIIDDKRLVANAALLVLDGATIS